MARPINTKDIFILSFRALFTGAFMQILSSALPVAWENKKEHKMDLVIVAWFNFVIPLSIVKCAVFILTLYTPKPTDLDIVLMELFWLFYHLLIGTFCCSHVLGYHSELLLSAIYAKYKMDKDAIIVFEDRPKSSHIIESYILPGWYVRQHKKKTSEEGPSVIGVHVNGAGRGEIMLTETGIRIVKEVSGLNMGLYFNQLPDAVLKSIIDTKKFPHEEMKNVVKEIQKRSGVPDGDDNPVESE